MIDIVKMTVLIADDMPGMVSSIRSIMKVLGYGKKFIPVTNGQEAWRILKKEPVDIAILDYNMPVMNGVEVLSRIREDRDLRDLPVVMVTAHSHQEFVAEAAESEIDAYILKPVTVKVLGDKVLHVVENANNPPPMVYHLQQARRFEDVGDIDAAIDEARLAMKANPKSSRPLRELGYYYFKKNDLKEAEKWLLKAAQMNSLDVFAFHYLGELYLKRNDIDKASRYFDKAMSISPRHLTRGIHFGKILVQKQKIEKAIQVFEKALTLSKNDLKLREEIASFCIETGAKGYGAKLLESIVRADPKRKDLLFKLGVALEEIGKHSKALSYLTNAGKEDRDNLEIKMHLATVNLALGRPIRAEKILKEVLKVDPKNKKAKELLKKCV
ncbi:MAG: tetratricopeptide repeat protein [Deltaproteobacteria bacterium]|nr:tetratricopeptide repeat protein [Deltaproteobacteria bacterium]MBW2019253.1 tetratricopeptide repeat protein [Deltaproteobacteria bacterium]MBW2074059.1 tetratricopeptide repeat protein [Deltaproteobacteria bacterium]